MKINIANNEVIQYRQPNAVVSAERNMNYTDIDIYGKHNTNFTKAVRGRDTLGYTDLKAAYTKTKLINTNQVQMKQYKNLDELERERSNIDYEMSSQQIATRMLSSLSGVSQQKIRTGDYESSTSDTKAVTSAIEMMQECDFFVDETPSITPMDLRGKARRMKREHGVDMIIVDYLQLMGVTRTRNFDQNRVNEISEITRSLKALAKELDIPVVALSQLNRRVEERNDKRPFLSDLRESGSIEQDADIVIFLYRDDQYNPSSENKNVAEVNISKHRNGPVGLEQLTFIPHCTRFEDYYPQVFEDTNDFGN